MIGSRSARSSHRQSPVSFLYVLFSLFMWRLRVNKRNKRLEMTHNKDREQTRDEEVHGLLPSTNRGWLCVDDSLYTLYCRRRPPSDFNSVYNCSAPYICKKIMTWAKSNIIFLMMFTLKHDMSNWLKRIVFLWLSLSTWSRFRKVIITIFPQTKTLFV